MANLLGRKLLIPVCVFLLLLVVTLTIWSNSRTSLATNDKQRFNLKVEHLQHQIQSRFYAYEQVLMGGVGFFEGSNEVSREEWRVYIEKLNLSEYFPGFQGVGFSQWIGDASMLAAHEKKSVWKASQNTMLNLTGRVTITLL